MTLRKDVEAVRELIDRYRQAQEAKDHCTALYFRVTQLRGRIGGPPNLVDVALEEALQSLRDVANAVGPHEIMASIDPPLSTWGPESVPNYLSGRDRVETLLQDTEPIKTPAPLA